MGERIDLYGRADQHVVSDPDGGSVQNNAVEIDETFRTDIKVVAVIAVERRPHQAVGCGVGHQFGHGFPVSFRIDRQGVQPAEPFGRQPPLFGQLPVHRFERFSGEHFLFFRHAAIIFR